MAEKVINHIPSRVGEQLTGSGTANTSTSMSLDGSLHNLRTFAEAFGTSATDTVPLVPAILVTGATWQHGQGTFTHGSPSTFQFSSIIASSDGGSAIAYNANSELRIFPDQLPQVLLSQTAGADADTTMAVGMNYVVDMSSWATADRTYTLPANAQVGDRIRISIHKGSASYELIIKPNTGDKINNGTAAAEWSRLFINGESAELVCVVEDSEWVVSYDGRRPCSCRMHRNWTNQTGFADAAVDQIELTHVFSGHVGNIADTANYQVNIRRTSTYLMIGTISANTAIIAGSAKHSRLSGDSGSVLYSTNIELAPDTASQQSITTTATEYIAAGGVVELWGQYDFSSTATIEGNPDFTYLSVVEVL